MIPYEIVAAPHSTASFRRGTALRRFLCSSLAVWAAFACLPKSTAVSGVLGTHGGVYGEFSAHHPIGYLGNDKYLIEGDNISLQKDFETKAYYPGTNQLIYDDRGSLSVRVDASGPSLFHLGANSSSISSGNYVPKSMAYVSASWRDVIYVDGQTPDKIRLRFEIDGVLHADRSPNLLTPADFAGSMLVTRLWDEILDPNNGSNNNAYWNVHEMFNTKSNNGQINFTQSSSDSVAYASKFVGFTLINRPHSFPILSATYDVPYRANYGGYAWSFWAAVGSSTANGSASADFGHTVKLVDVQDQLGNSLVSSIRFDSGRSLTGSVPEPGGGTLLIIGLVGASLGTSVRRRMKF